MANDQYALVREQLYKLGFEQPMPLGATSLVAGLLDDLVKTTSNLKRFDEENRQLKKERVAWNLSVEPYKCDNSRLLAECNRLHLDLLKQREESRLQLCAANRQRRTLETDNQCLQRQNADLCDQLAEMSSANSRPTTSKIAAGGATSKKPQFVSTVRPKSAYTVGGGAATRTTATAVRPGSTGKVPKGSAIAGHQCGDCARVGRDGNGNEMQRLRNELQSQTEFVEELNKQLTSRDREINRLTRLLNGGQRSTAGLGQDCCFRGVSILSEDVTTLQRQKLQLQQELQTAVAEQHEAKERACRQAEQIRSMEHDAVELEHVALNIEEKYNQRLAAKNDECVKLQARIEKMRLHGRSDRPDSKANVNLENDLIQMRTEVQRASEQAETAQTNVKLFAERNEELSVLNEKLMAKNSRLKTRYKALQEEHSNQKQSSNQTDTATSPRTPHVERSSDSNLAIERDYYQKEYLKLLNRPQPEDTELHRLQAQLRTKDAQLNELQHTLQQHQLQKIGSSHSVTAVLNRVERENGVMQAECERMRQERDELRERLHAHTAEQAGHVERLEQQCRALSALNGRLEAEAKTCGSNVVALQATAEMLRQRVADVESMVRDRDAECTQLRTSYQQMKILQEQTEKALAHRQSALSQRDSQLHRVESRLSVRDSSRDHAESLVQELRAQVASLQSQLDSVDRQKDGLVESLDTKTEKLFQMEAELLRWQTMCAEKQADAELLQQQINAVDTENRQKEGTLRQTSSESEAMRRQVAQLVTQHENAMAENRRLEGDLADQSAEHDATRKRLRACESECERLKSQLTQYVHEVQKAEELLTRKEIERDEMLDHYKSLSRDAVELEGNNHTLELQATSAQRGLQLAEAELETLREQLAARAVECERLDRQVAELSRQTALGGGELEQCMAAQQRLSDDLDANRLLCERLDQEKLMLRAELDECSAIRAQLERDNERLRGDLRVQQTGERAAQQNVQQLLSTAREDLDQQRAVASRQSGELQRLQQRADELQTKLADERAKAARNEALVQEYGVQIKELRQQLTDQRFAKGGSGTKKAQEQSQQPEYDRSQVTNQLSTISDHERSQRELSQKFSLRPSSGPNDTTTSTETSQLHSIGRYLSRRFNDATDVQNRNDDQRFDCIDLQHVTGRMTPASSVYSGSEAEAVYFAPSSHAESIDQAADSLSSTSRTFQIDSNAALADGGNGEAVELAQMHAQFMLKTQESTEGLLIDAEEFCDNASIRTQGADDTEKSSEDDLERTELPRHSLSNPVNSLESHQSLIEHMLARNDNRHIDLDNSIDNSNQSAMNYLTGSNDTLHSRAVMQQNSSLTTWKTCSRSDQPLNGVPSTDQLKPEPTPIMRRSAAPKPSASVSKKRSSDRPPAVGSKSRIAGKPLQTMSTADANHVAKSIVDIIQREKTTPRSQRSSARSHGSSAASTTTVDSYHSTMPSLSDIAQRRPRTAVVVGALRAQTFDTSHLPPPPPFHRKRVAKACGRINTINVHVQPIGEVTKARISANCVIRRA